MSFFFTRKDIRLHTSIFKSNEYCELVEVVAQADSGAKKDGGDGHRCSVTFKMITIRKMNIWVMGVSL